MNHGAGAAGFPSRNRAALALVFGMHMLALLCWMQQRQQRPSTPAVARMVSILLQPQRPLSQPRAVPPPPPSAPARPGARPATPHAAPPRVPAPVPALEPATETAPEPAAPAAAPRLEDARVPIDVQQAIRAQKEAGDGFALGLSKHQAGRIDRELRKGKSGVPDEPDTPMGRFRRGLDAAHIDRSNAVYEDSYTSPDGVIIYRKRIGNTTICRRSGSINPLGMRGMLFANEAGDVPCPKGVQWKKD
ncbi:hypothetical protein ACI48D_12635 [Massilia sp. LXY-6]|uniref:hypothetical protein n=1 Tax=Massilia sp. LXY-6 TaxID=3379823 RepID=UPI003EE28313